jgi:hypothetical protein
MIVRFGAETVLYRRNCHALGTAFDDSTTSCIMDPHQGQIDIQLPLLDWRGWDYFSTYSRLGNRFI